MDAAIQSYGDKMYKVCQGTWYNVETSGKVIDILEQQRCMRSRIRLFYGDTVTGECWMDEYDTIGSLSRSMGPVKIPILTHNSRSTGDGGILDHCVVAIQDRAGHYIYKHPLFHLRPVVSSRYFSEKFGGIVYVNHETFARTKTYEQAIRLAAFIQGERWAK